MEWSFEQADGAVTVQQNGSRAICQAIRPSDRNGLYKAWLLGEKGNKVLLGTLIPEGGALRLRRVIDIPLLERQQVWPPAGAEVTMAYAFEKDAPPPPNWCWTEKPGRLMASKTLARSLEGVRRVLMKRDGEGFYLAIPYSSQRIFPLSPLFCLSRLEQVSGKWYVLFRFSSQGNPELLHNISCMGEDRGAI